jgi:hypothetical protein
MKKKAITLLAVASGLTFAGCRNDIDVGFDHDRGWHHGRRMEIAANTAPASNFQDLSNTYGIQPASAVAILTTVNSKQTTASLGALGLSTEDAQALQDLRMPSDTSIHNVAMTLNESDESITSILKDYISDTQAENESSSN